EVLRAPDRAHAALAQLVQQPIASRQDHALHAAAVVLTQNRGQGLAGFSYLEPGDTSFARITTRSPPKARRLTLIRGHAYGEAWVIGLVSGRSWHSWSSCSCR